MRSNRRPLATGLALGMLFGPALVSLWCFLGGAGEAMAQQGADDRPVVRILPSDSGTTGGFGGANYVRMIPLDLQITNKGAHAWAVLPHFDFSSDCRDCSRVEFLAGGAIGLFAGEGYPPRFYIAPTSQALLRVYLRVDASLGGGLGRQARTIELPIQLNLKRLVGEREEDVPAERVTYKLTVQPSTERGPYIHLTPSDTGGYTDGTADFNRMVIRFDETAGGQSSQQELEVGNNADQTTLEVKSMRFLGGDHSPFRVVGGGPPFSLTSDFTPAYRTVQLSFTPPKNGLDVYNDVLEIQSNDPYDPKVWVPVRGVRKFEGTPPPTNTFVTGEGTENRIEWKTDAQAFDRGEKVPMDMLGPIPGLPSFELGKPGGGYFEGLWQLTPNSGLRLKLLHFDQTVPHDRDAALLVDPGTGGSFRPHRLAEELQWRNSRVVFQEGGMRREMPISLLPVLHHPPFKFDVHLPNVYLQTQEGTRTFDQKKFAWAVGTEFEPVIVPDPNGAAVAYLIDLREDFAVGTPEADQGPGEAAVAIKLFPTLTATIDSSDPLTSVTRPGFASDLKMVFAPRLTRHDQHRSGKLVSNSETNPDPGGDLDDPAQSQYLPKALRDTNVVLLISDTNHGSRPLANELPGQINWRTLFDYAEPDLLKEKSFDAVVWPRSRTNEKEFKVYWPLPSSQQVEDDKLTAGVEPGETQAYPLRMKRELGQGQFDNLHIHPYVGYDVPAGGDRKSQNPEAELAMLEAPLGADEEIHFHWRWGRQIFRSGSIILNHDDPAFKGYSAEPNDKEPWHKLAGAPLIPANQSLRLRITDPILQNADDPLLDTRLDHRTTAVWYRAEVHQANLGEPSQFCVHGFGMAYHLVPTNFLGISALPLLNNQDLLGAPTLIGVPFYHDFRWDNRFRLDRQRVPTTSDKGLEGLEYNRLGIPGPNNEPPVEKDFFDPLTTTGAPTTPGATPSPTPNPTPTPGTSPGATPGTTPPTTTGKINLTLTLSASEAKGGTTVTGTVHLSQPAPAGGVQLILESDTPTVASVPGTLTIPAGADAGTFSITTSPVSFVTDVSLFVHFADALSSIAGDPVSVDLRVRP